MGWYLAGWWQVRQGGTNSGRTTRLSTSTNPGLAWLCDPSRTLLLLTFPPAPCPLAQILFCNALQRGVLASTSLRLMFTPIW